MERMKLRQFAFGSYITVIFDFLSQPLMILVTCYEGSFWSLAAGYHNGIWFFAKDISSKNNKK